MQTVNKNQLQALFNLKCRMLSLEKLAAGYMQNAKALKLCLKLIKLESKEAKKCTTVSSYDITGLQQKYEALSDIIKRIIKASNPGAKSKASSDLGEFIDSTQADISEMNEILNPVSENVRKIAASIDGTTKILSKKIESGTQILSEKATAAAEGIKKIFKTEEDEN